MRRSIWAKAGGLLLAGLMLFSAAGLTGSAGSASFENYRLVKKSLPYDFCKGGMDDKYFNIGVYAKDNAGETVIRWGLMEKRTFRVVYPCRYSSGWLNADSEGILEVLSTEGDGLVLLPDAERGGCFLGDLKGRELTREAYDEVIASVQLPSGDSVPTELIAVRKDDKWGALDMRGRQVLPCRYDSAPLFLEGIAMVQEAEETLFINRSGERLFAGKAELEGLQIDGESFFHDGLCIARKDEPSGSSLYGVIDKTGAIQMEFAYQSLSRLAGGRFLAGQDADQPEDGVLYGVVTAEGESVVPAVYQELYPLSGYSKDAVDANLFVGKRPQDAAVSAPSAWYVFRAGKGEISPASDTPYSAHMVNGKLRFMQDYAESGAYIYDENFQKLAGPYRSVIWGGDMEGHDPRYLVVSMDGQEGLLNAAGQVVLPAEYESLSLPRGGVLKARKNGKVGIIRDTGEVLTDYQYDDMAAIVLQPFGLRLFCAIRYHEDGLSSWEAEDGRTDECWLIDERGHILSEKNGGLYGWGGLGYNECSVIISAMPYRAPSAVRPAPRVMAMSRLAATPSAESGEELLSDIFYTAERTADYQLEDGGVNVTAPPDSIPEGTTLSARAVTEGALYERVKAALTGNIDSFTLFDTALTNEGAAIQPTAAVRVSLPLPANSSSKTIRVYSADEDGRLTPLTVSEADGAVSFDASRLGTFVLAVEKPSEPTGSGGEPSTGTTAGEDDNPPTGVAAGAASMIPAIASGAAALLSRKRKRR